jgi:two-component system, NarL family, sensor histidine kinase UhpB
MDSGRTGAVGAGSARDYSAALREPAGAAVRVLRGALSISIFYKILIANVVALLAFAAAVVVLAERLSDAGVVVALVATGVALTAALNAAVLRLALRPLVLLSDAAARVARGELDARVGASPLADRELQRLAQTFNAILDSNARQRQRLRNVAVTALGAAEEERRRLARELHDGTAQELAALLLQLRVARGVRSDDDRDGQLAVLGEQLAAAVDRVRSMAGALRPPALDMLGLPAALEAMARQLGEGTSLRVRTRLNGVSGALSPEAELAIYRVVQEAATNAVRHARASTLEIGLVHRDGVVTASVTDDGRGFAVDAVLENGAVGLFGMQERAAYVGGHVAFSSRADEGTRVEITIPEAGGRAR